MRNMLHDAKNDPFLGALPSMESGWIELRLSVGLIKWNVGWHLMMPTIRQP
jgi:hypothetical protein